MGAISALYLAMQAFSPVSYTHLIKYPFWRMTHENPSAVYACVNLGEAYAPREIAARSICIDADIDAVLRSL